MPNDEQQPGPKIEISRLKINSLWRLIVLLWFLVGVCVGLAVASFADLAK